jgi:hypothetical protein
MGVSIPGTANIDDDYPLVNPVTETQVPHEDQSSPVATTGDTMTFSLFSPVTEEMLSVEVVYKMGNLRTSKTLEPMDASWGSLWGSTVDVPSDLTVPIEYIFVITEMDWSPTVSNISFVDVHDDDPPWILDDITPSTASTGQELTFEVDVRDNIGVNYTRVEYWYGDDQAVNSSMVETVTDRWSHSIIVSPGLGDLHYIIHIVDMSGNWNSSEMTTLALEDKTPPEFGEDTTTEEGTTGDPVTFQVEVTDDVAVNNVSVEYGVYGTFYYEVADLVADGNVYSLEITLPTDMVGTVSYRFHAWDTSGNNATSEEDGIIVEDDDPPTATVELTLPAQVETGGSYQVTVSVFDNVGVWTVTIVMTFDTGRDEPSHRSQTLQGFGGTFTGNVLIGTNEVGTITHYIEVEDMYENYYNSSETVSDLVDTIPPDMDFLVPITTQVGREESIEVKATDNIGIVDVRWKGLPFKPDGFFANGSFDEPGEHRITVIVVDAAGNEATEDFVVFVEDDVSAATVMLQIAAILVLVAVGLFLVKWLVDRRSRESMGDPELEDAPSDEIPR